MNAVSAVDLSQARSLPTASKIAGRITTAALLLLLLTGALYLLVRRLDSLFRLAEAGYGDSYILYDIEHFQRTGQIYRDPSTPPYLPAEYSPLVYRLYALPGGIIPENPFFGPRLIALAAFFACVAMVVSIARKLIPTRTSWLWALLIALSVKCLDVWPLQLRGDFPGIFFSLTAVRFLLSRSRYAVLLAGLCAGFATQFKFTYVAALVAGFLWLLLGKRWKELAIFLAAGLSTSAGLYLVLWLREPRMISQMLAFSPGIADVGDAVRLSLVAIQELAVLLALPALAAVTVRRSPRWRLLLLFLVVSFGFGLLTDIQAGGDINYFYEGLLALVPLSVMGAFRLLTWSRQRVPVALFLTGLFVIHFWMPDARSFYQQRSKLGARAIKAENDLFQGTANALHGERIFSTVPRVALLDPNPALMEPYLLNYMQKLGKIDPKPILDRIQSDEFDVVITGYFSSSYRGVTMVGPIGRAIVEAYRPYCVLHTYGKLFLFLPRNRVADSLLIQRLQEVGCAPYPEPGTSFWKSEQE